ncbi:MAG: putative toxin-antitoxin system toxin component, PIN family [Alphaproteobacteria bacterium]|jgi:putative PIN family toxin of toxin-antitoxin system|nr:putative toxin-antitoxin system toxin component, PIN family [Alphaproteobacteria bacterium]
MRLVIDTGVLVSYTIRPNYPFATIVDNLVTYNTILYSSETLNELITVLERRKFDSYVSRLNRQKFISRFIDEGEHVNVSSNISVYVDAKDNKFLCLALDGRADAIVASDRHLTDLHPFHNIPILTPGQIFRKFENG